MTQNCFHCAEPVPPGFQALVNFEGVDQPTCCYGCQAVMQAIIEANLDDYYRFRTEPAALGMVPDNIAVELEKFQIYDEPEFVSQYVVAEPNGSTAQSLEVTLSVEGMRCGACVWLLERSVSSLKGVSQCSFNYATGRALIRFDAERVNLSEILMCISAVGYRAIPFDVRKRENQLASESRLHIQRLFVAGIAMMQVMMYALPHYLSDAGDVSEAHTQLLRWASMVLTTPVVIFSAKPFIAGAWRNVRTLSAGMDLPVSIGVLSAYFTSVWNTLNGSGETYFDTVSMFVFLLLLARYLEWRVQCRAMRSIDDVSIHAPETAQVLDAAGQWSTIPAIRLQLGNTIRVNSGDTVPVDATVVSQRGSIDCSVLTGESMPITVRPGDTVPGGAHVAGAPLTLIVSAPQNQSVLSTIGKMVERGQADKPQIVKLADKLAGYFVVILLLFAVLVYGIWLTIDADRAAAIAITVLVVSCPCALSLATPAAIAAATGRLLESRLLITRGHVLETTSQITDVVFDKTGTLTLGSAQVTHYDIAPDYSSEHILALAAAMEQGAAHPFAKAISALAHAPAQEKISAIKHVPGFGISARVGQGHYIRLGSSAWCGLQESSIDEFNDSHPRPIGVASEVILSQSNTEDYSSQVSILARFLIADQLRPEAKATMNMLEERGLKLHLLSGDQQEVVADVATALSIPDWQAQANPDDKQQYVKSLQASGARVLMVGDGINDAPVLATSDVSMALGNATSLARTSADTISLSNGLYALPILFQQAQLTARIVKQNLSWALAYNAISLPAAALGLVSPWLAAIGMATSSLLVAANSARLWGKSLRSSEPPVNHQKDLVWNP